MKCCVLSCNKCSEKQDEYDEKLSFHTFPSDESLRESWRKAINRDPGWNPTKYTRICSLHFEENVIYETMKGYKKIRLGAIPTLNLTKSELAEMTNEDRRENKAKSKTDLNKYVIINDTPRKLTLKQEINSLKIRDRPLRKRKEVQRYRPDDPESNTIRTYKDRPHEEHEDADDPTSILDINPEPEVRIKVENELDLPMECDPLQQDDDDDYTVTIKEECEELDADVHQPSSSRKELLKPIGQRKQRFKVGVDKAHSSRESVSPLVQKAPSTSKSLSNFPLATVVMDNMQIFANSVAEQLRALPINRALLLQVEIQTMIDNERQLALHEY